MYNLEVSNFQSIENLKIEIKGFTILKGISSAGKSAVRRAIRFLLNNEWEKSFLRNGAALCRVVLSSGSWEIVREKGPKVNSYSVTVNGIKKDYSKIGIDVPFEFKDLGISKLDCEGFDCDVIVYSQRDPLFIVAYSEIEKTQVLNKLFGTARYELAGKLVKRDILSGKTRVNQINSELDDLRRESEVVTKVNEILSGCLEIFLKFDLVSDLESNSKKYNTLEAEELALNALHSSLVGLEKTASDLDSIQYYLGEVHRSTAFSFELEELKSKIDLLNNVYTLSDKHGLLEDFFRLSSRQESVSWELKSYPEINFSDFLNTISKLDLISDLLDLNEYYDRLCKVRDVFNIYKTILSKLFITNSFIDMEAKRKILQEEVDDLDFAITLEMKSKKVCPTCGQVIL